MYMTRMTAATSTKVWLKWNLTAELLLGGPEDRYLRLRYEDFVARPRAEMGRVLGLLGEERAALPFEGERRLRLDVNHTLAGNPSRFERGEVEVRPDERWRGAMPRRARLAVLALAWPLFLRYGYPRPPGGGGGDRAATETAGAAP